MARRKDSRYCINVLYLTTSYQTYVSIVIEYRLSYCACSLSLCGRSRGHKGAVSAFVRSTVACNHVERGMARWSLIGVLFFVFCVSSIPSRSDCNGTKSAVVSTLQNACFLALRSVQRLLLGSADDFAPGLHEIE